MDAKTKAVLGIPGVVTVGGRDLVVPPQTPADAGRTHDEMRKQAGRLCTNPLVAVSAVAKDLDPAVFSEAVRAAVAMGSGGGAEPTREAVIRQYGELDGVRFRLWYQARKGDPSLTREQVAALVTEDNVFEVADALDTAIGLKGLDAGKGQPGSGAS